MHTWLQFDRTVRRLTDDTFIDRNDRINDRIGYDRELSRQLSKYQFKHLALRITDSQTPAEIVVAVFFDVNGVTPRAQKKTIAEGKPKPATGNLEIVRRVGLNRKLNGPRTE